MSSLAAVFQIGSLGDSIVSIPSLLSLKKLLPDCSEYVLVTPSYTKMKVTTREIFEMAWGPKAQVEYAGPGKRLKQVFSVPMALAKLRYFKPKYCISFMPADREASRLARDRKFFRAAGARQLLGFEPFPPEMFRISSDVSLERTEAFLRFRRLWKEQASEEFGQYTGTSILCVSDQARERCQQWVKANRRIPGKRLIAICPFSNFPSKDIADATIRTVTSQLSEICDAEVVLVGGRKDFVRAAGILKAAPGLNACGQFSIQESAALFQKCDLVICADSGPMHLAAAVGVPMLAICSRISAQFARWLPFGRQSTILYREVACAGCFQVHCPVEGHPCMSLITAQHIMTAALKKLRREPVSAEELGGTKVLIW